MRDRRSPSRRSPRRKERSPVPRKSSPNSNSPARNSSSRGRSPIRDREGGPKKSPKRRGSRSPGKSGHTHSPSPRTKRLKRALAESEQDKSFGNHKRNVNRDEDNVREEGTKERRKEQHDIRNGPKDRRSRHEDEHDEGRRSRHEAEHNEREERQRGQHKQLDNMREGSSERRSAHEKNNGGSTRLSKRDSSASPHHRHHSYSSRSPPRSSRAGAREEVANSRASEQPRDGDHDSVAMMKAAEEALEAKDKQKPSFELSGKLAEETNRVRGVTLLFNEPPDARKPDIRWRLYVFKGGEVLNEPLYVHRQSCYLFGRERRVADIPTDHPSCSKQHAVLQYRLVEKEQHDGMMAKQVRPYIMDLGSTNGTFINDNRIEPQRYYELFEKDTIRFGNSSREYVILHENSAG